MAVAEAATGEYRPEVIADLERMVRAALPVWDFAPTTATGLLNISENATFRFDEPESGRRLVLRLHRIGYHGRDEILSELAWMAALRAEALVPIPSPIPGRDGELVHRLPSPAGYPDRYAVAFEFVEGAEPSGDLTEWFRRLGGITGRLHDHCRRWRPPKSFRRGNWTFETMIGPRPIWGSWRNAVGLDTSGRLLLGRAAALVEARLARHGTGPGRFGLIHADLRLANLLVYGEHLTVIDFDDCGFGWFGYDFAAAVSFIEHEPQVPALMDAWIEGYRSEVTLDPAVAAELPVFVMLRRMLLLGWIASHGETATARQMGSRYTRDSLAMAEDLLTRFG